MSDDEETSKPIELIEKEQEAEKPQQQNGHSSSSSLPQPMDDPEPELHQVKSEAPLMFSSPMKSNFFVLWFRQLLVMLKTDAILTFVRGWKATVLTILAPIVFLAILYLLQEVAKNYGIAENLHPQTYEIPPLPLCKVRWAFFSAFFTSPLLAFLPSFF